MLIKSFVSKLFAVACILLMVILLFPIAFGIQSAGWDNLEVWLLIFLVILLGIIANYLGKK